MKMSKNTIIPKGFKISGIHCGIKKSKRKDLGLVYSLLPCNAAGMFTSNKAQAASLKVCKEHLKNKQSRALIVNSGNANCFVGSKGKRDAIDIVKALAKSLGVSARSILIASTGIIGKPLPLKIIKGAIPSLCCGLKKGRVKDFAESILTTDTFKKVASLKIKIKNKPVSIIGVAKGAGMIYPQLETSLSKHATMLVFILTDVAIKKLLLKSTLESAVDNSFNCISVDGCTSTNDTVLVLANGAAKNTPIVKRDKDYELFSKGLSYVCKVLSWMIVRDAEGATKQIEVLVKGAKSAKEAKLAAIAVANSNLFKTAMFGNNPNWGRVVAAIGAAGISIDENKLEIAFNSQRVFNKGKINPKFKNTLRSKKYTNVNIDLNSGSFEHIINTSDLTPAYVKINAGYN